MRTLTFSGSGGRVALKLATSPGPSKLCSSFFRSSSTDSSSCIKSEASVVDKSSISPSSKSVAASRVVASNASFSGDGVLLK